MTRRAMLRATLGATAALAVGCGPDDADVFAGEVAEPRPTTTAAPTTTRAPTTEPPTTEPAATEPSTTTEATAEGATAVAGEMIIEFTYTQAPGGKNEFPYVAVWIEDAAGELLATVALFYQVERRGARWLDHLDLWWDVDQAHQAETGTELEPILTAATRAPGAYTVAWDGSADGGAAAAGDYFVCIEAVREDGPRSLIREPFTLAGELALTALPDDGELSAASVRIEA